MAKYQDGRGWLYEVHAGLGQDSWKASYKKPDRMGWHCVRSKYLPWRDTPAEAEADLQAYAEKKGLFKED